MGFRKDSYATVWEVKPISPTMTKVRLSVDRKNKMTDQYEQEFGDFTVFVGSACAAKAMKLKNKDRIKLGDVDVSNKYDKDKRVTYYDFKVFDFEMEARSGEANSRSSSNNVARNDGYTPRSAAAYEGEPDLDDEDVPF